MKELEQHIKQQLEERKIQPSSRAWDEIQNELNNSSRKPLFTWAWKAVAAVFLIGAMIGFYVLQNQKMPPEKSITTMEKELPTLSHDHLNIAERDEEIPIKQNVEYFPEEPTDIVENYIPRNTKPSTLNDSKLNNTHIENEEKRNVAMQPIEDLKIMEKERFISFNPTESNDLKSSIALQERDTSESQSSKRIRKTDPQKLLFYVENEKQLKKPNRVAFRNNTIEIDLSNDD